MSSKMICSDCGTQGNPKTITKGSILIELILRLAFIIPGLLYTTRRLTSRYKACRTCGSDSIIPINSPMGQKLLKEIQGNHVNN